MKEMAHALLRAAAGDRGRGMWRRAQHALGLRPRVNWSAAHSLRFPDDRRAGVVISADLELAWAWRYARVPDPLACARRRALQGRENLPTILDLCDAFSIPVTWATIGHLFLPACTREDGPVHPDLPRLPHFANRSWRYQHGDWFDADPCSAGPEHPDWRLWYGPDLVEAILRRPTPHEIGCHSFSHIAFTDRICPPEVAGAELQRCVELADRWGLHLRSFTFPGNFSGNFESLRETGFSSYRCESGFELDVPRRDPLGLWQIPGGLCLDKPYASWSGREFASLATAFVDAAIDHGLLASMWFHPESDPRDFEEVLPEVLAHIAARRSEVWVGTMSDLARWLEAAEEEDEEEEESNPADQEPRPSAALGVLPADQSTGGLGGADVLPSA